MQNTIKNLKYIRLAQNVLKLPEKMFFFLSIFLSVLFSSMRFSSNSQDPFSWKIQSKIKKHIRLVLTFLKITRKNSFLLKHFFNLFIAINEMIKHCARSLFMLNESDFKNIFD